ncbi:MAG TPA: GFA family protein, partial [Burkholderiaceae bacterium]|nr:GFA family protein [Burkholderiaceae bacterium]
RGRWLTNRFCPRCGTTVLVVAEALAGLSGVSLGVLDEPGRVPIRCHAWVRSKRDWVEPPADATVHDRLPERSPPR